MASKKEKAEALENMRDALKACGPEGDSTLYVQWVGGGPTPYGRTDYLDIRVIRPDAMNHGSRPGPAEWLSLNAATALGYRFNAKRDAVSVGGCGYSKSHQIVASLASLVGHALYCTEHGWLGPGSDKLRGARPKRGSR